MRLALRAARLGAGGTHPNPRVGAVAVRNGAVVGVGAHLACGGPHAEAALIRAAEPAALRGATLYVTLEPCAHVGRTPACAPAVAEAGFMRVVAAMGDPHPLVAGRGFAALRKAGVDVAVGLLEKHAARLNAPFLWALQRGRAFVTLKAAASLDGRLAAADGTSQWISGPRARELAHRLRSECDAVLVGRGTLERDGARLSARPRHDPLAALRRRIGGDGPGWPHQPARVVVDSRAAVAERAGLLARMAATPGGPWLVACDERAPGSRLRRLREAGIRCWSFPVGRGARGVDLRALTERLAREGLPDLLVEGGPSVASSFVREDLVDRHWLCLAPRILGGPAVWLGALGFRTLDEAPRLEVRRVRRIGRDVLIEALSPSAARMLAGEWKQLPAGSRMELACGAAADAGSGQESGCSPD